jgi:hypothetical protein
MRLSTVRTSYLHANRVWVLVLTLLWAQSLGLWHGIVHGGHGVGSVHASLADAARLSDRAICSVSPARFAGSSFTCAERSVTQAFGIEGAPVSHSFFESLFGDHEAADCQLFDQLSHGDALATAPVLALPLGVPAAHFAHLTGLAVARWAALFQARAPPSFR